jgi:hypothetical protein
MAPIFKNAPGVYMEAIKKGHENNIDLIQKIRNDLVKDFLDERYLREYLADRYHVREISNVKVEFIKKELKELLQVPLDKTHYDSLLTRLEQTDATTLAEGDDQLFYSEIEKILRRYV